MKDGSDRSAASAGWRADPSGRHQYRYWDGTCWTHHVADDGKTSVDPLVQAPKKTTSTTAASESSGLAPEKARKPRARTAEPDRGKAKSSDQLQCVTCSEVLEDWHYGFESCVFSPLLGWRCSNCGQVFCEEHAPSTFRNEGDKCSCGGWVTTVKKGPALSSMVDAADRNGKYGGHLHAPGSKRNVRQG